MLLAIYNKATSLGDKRPGLLRLRHVIQRLEADPDTIRAGGSTPSMPIDPIV